MISSDRDEAARARALRLLGCPVKAAPLAGVGVILATAMDPTRFPTGVRAGIGATESSDRSWREARTSLRFTTPRQPVVHYTGLGR